MTPCILPMSPAQLVTCQMITAQLADHRYLGLAALSVPLLVGLACAVKAFGRRTKGKRLHLSLPLPWGRHAATRHLKRDLTAANPRAWKDSDLQVLERTKHAAGEELLVELPGGVHAGIFEGQGKDSGTEFLASALSAQRVHVDRHPDNARWATINIMSRNPLVAVTRSPLVAVTEWDWHRGVPCGISVKGSDVVMNLAWRNVLVSGTPGAGKSEAEASIAAAAVLDPRIGLYLFDANRVNLSVWKDCAEVFVRNDLGHAIGVLERLVKVVDERSQILEELGEDKLPMTGELREMLLLIDELAFFIANAERPKDSKYCTALLADIVRRGRFVGIEVVAATQRPSSQIISTDLRDLFVWRWAMYCATQAAYIMALGEDWAKRGAEIRMGNPGEGLLLHESGTLEHLRAYNMPMADRHLIAARAATLRAGAKQLTPVQSASEQERATVRLSVVEGSEPSNGPPPVSTPVLAIPESRGNHPQPVPNEAPEPNQPRFPWTERDIRILQRLAGGPTRRKAIEDEYFRSKAACSDVMDRLIKREVATKQADPFSRREIQYAITDTGRAVLTALEGEKDEGGPEDSAGHVGTTGEIRPATLPRDAREQKGGDVA